MTVNTILSFGGCLRMYVFYRDVSRWTDSLPCLTSKGYESTKGRQGLRELMCIRLEPNVVYLEYIPP